MKIFGIAFLRILFVLTFMTVVGLSACSKNTNDNTKVETISPKVITDIPFSAAAYDWPHSNSDIKPDPRVNFGRLQNGMRYAILPVPDEKGTISIQMNVSVGFNDEAEGVYGIAHILEHMAFRGARSDTEDSIVHDLQKLGAGFGSDLNGFTETDNTHYRVNLTSSKPADIKRALKNFSQLVKAPNLTDQHLEQEKKVVLAELKGRDTLKYQANQDARRFRYPDRSRETTPGIGTEESLEAITLADVNVFFKTHYRPEKVLLVVTGGVNATQTEASISQLFSEWVVKPARKTRPIKKNAVNLESFPPLGTYKKVGAKTQLNAVENTPPSLMNDVVDYREKVFAETMVHSMIRTRLKPRIEADLKVSWINFSKTRETDYDIRNVTLAAKDYSRAMTLFEEERLRAIKYGFESEEINYALKKMETRLESLAERPTFINAWSEASALRKSFNIGRVFNSNTQNLDSFKTFSKNTSAQTYHDAAKDMWGGFTPRYWTQSNTSMSETVRQVKAAREALSQIEIAPPKSFEVESFQKPEFTEKGVIASRDTIKSGDKVHRLLFKNGARLNYQQNKTEPNNIEIYVTLKGDLNTFVDQYSAIAERVSAFSRADIKGVTKSEMDRTFVGQEASFYTALMLDNLIVGSTTRPQDLEATLNVITRFITDVDVYSQNYKDRYKKNLTRTKTLSKSSPLITGALKVPSAYSGAPTAFRSERSNLFPKPIELDTVKSIRQIIESGAIEVGIVGDFEPEVLEDLFAKSLGALPERTAPRQAPVQKHKNITHIDPGVTSLTYKGTDKQMAVFYCWPKDADDNVEEEAMSTLGAKVFQNRLVERFRQDLGVTYSPQTVGHSNLVFSNFSYDCFAVQIAPKDEEKVHKNLQSVIEKLITQPITKTELIRAREPVSSLFKQYLNSNKMTAPVTAIAFSRPEALDEHRTIISALDKIQLKTLNSVLSKRYDRSKLHVFRVQHYQNKAALKANTLRVKSAMGDVSAQVEFGKILKQSSKETDQDAALELFKNAANQGNLEAHFQMGKYNALSGADPKLAVKHLELANEPKEGAYLLGNLYFKNPIIFPDVTDARIMELFTLSAESGYAFGQSSLAQRYKDGSLTKRNEVEALKWALISRGKNMNMNSIYIKGFKKNLSDNDQKKAQKAAQTWMKSQSNRAQE